MTDQKPRGGLAKLDHAIFRVERTLAWVLFIAMAFLMFVNVMHEIFDRAEGRFSGLFLRWFGDPSSEASKAFFHGTVSNVFNIVMAFLICLMALRTAKRASKLSWPKALAGAAGITLVLTGLIKLILVGLPNGIIWAPYVSLVFTVWVGLLGASMATYERRHLAIELGEKIWPSKLVPYVRSFACLLAAGSCVFLFVLSYMSISMHHTDWMKNKLSNIIAGTPIPISVAMAVFLWAFGMMTLRFLGLAVRSITHPEEGGGEVLPAIPGATADEEKA